MQGHFSWEVKNTQGDCERLCSMGKFNSVDSTSCWPQDD